MTTRIKQLENAYSQSTSGNLIVHPAIIHDLLKLFHAVDEEIESDGNLRTMDLSRILDAMDSLREQSDLTSTEAKAIQINNIDAAISCAIKDSSSSVYVVDLLSKDKDGHISNHYSVAIPSSIGSNDAYEKAVSNFKDKLQYSAVNLKLHKDDINLIIEGVSRTDGVTNEDIYSLATGKSCDYLGNDQWRTNGKTISQNELIDDILVALLKKDDHSLSLVKCALEETENRPSM